MEPKIIRRHSKTQTTRDTMQKENLVQNHSTLKRNEYRNFNLDADMTNALMSTTSKL